jgi:hypothetical protein
MAADLRGYPGRRRVELDHAVGIGLAHGWSVSRQLCPSTVRNSQPLRSSLMPAAARLASSL